MKPFVILIAGGTASGKTTLARLLAARTGALHISHDRYYRDIPDPRGFNYDHPDALDTTRLVDDLSHLVAGEAAELPVYDFTVHARRPEIELVEPRPLVLVEGILVLWDARLRGLANFSVYVHAADDIRLVRRIRRDISERGRDVESVLFQYLRSVRPMHLQYVEPSRTYADLTVSGEGEIEDAYGQVKVALPH